MGPQFEDLISGTQETDNSAQHLGMTIQPKSKFPGYSSGADNHDLTDVPPLIAAPEPAPRKPAKRKQP